MNTETNIKITGFFQIIQTIFLVILYNILAASVFPPETSAGTVIPSIWYILSSQIIGFLFTGFTLIILYKIDSVTDFLKFELKPSKVLLTIGYLFLAIMLINGIQYLQQQIVPVHLISSYLSMDRELISGYMGIAKMLGDVHPALLYLIGGLLPAVCEEFFFRGFLLNLSMKYYSKPASLIIVSLIFSLMHFQMIAALPLFIFGLLLGMLTLYTGKLSYAVLLHFLNNSITLYLVSSS